MAKSKGVLEFLADEFRDALRDVRQKLVEQGWFGQVTTPKPVVEMSALREMRSPAELYGQEAPPSHDFGAPSAPSPLERRTSFEEQWAPREPAHESTDIDRAQELDR